MEEKTTNEQMLEFFVRQTAQKYGKELAEEDVVGIAAELEERIERGMISALSDEKLVELHVLLKAGDLGEAGMERFIEDAGVDSEAVAKKVMEEFENELRESK